MSRTPAVSNYEDLCRAGEKHPSAADQGKQGDMGAVEKVGYLRRLKNIQMRGLRRLRERGVLQRTPQGRESSITKQMDVLQPPDTMLFPEGRRDSCPLFPREQPEITAFVTGPSTRIFPVFRDCRSFVFTLMLAVLIWAVPAHGPAAEFDSGKAAFMVGFRDEVTQYRVTGVFVLPGEKIAIEAITDRTGPLCTLRSPRGRLVEEERNRWVWQAPAQVGSFPVVIRNPAQGDSVVLNVFVMVPFDSLKGEYLNDYCIGEYPSIPLIQLSMYKPPAGFIEVAEADLHVLISPHFQLGQFLCKQVCGYPKYLVLRERLVLKLELILEEVNEAGYRCDTFHIMSGYRTPHYNHAIGNVKYSRHLWGGAADIFVDTAPLDDMMDDLNRDGKIDYRDADVIYEIIDRMYGKPWYERFLGGLAKYKKTPSHGPFVHVDVRGTRARWCD